MPIHPLHEGLERHSLQYLVSPLLSIDEYESKIDDRRMIVTGFHVRDYQPARDLSQFIEKSSIRPSDTEVSPAPTDDGFYLVFVEMSRDDDYPDRVIEMVQQVQNLTGEEEWKFQAYGEEEPRKLTAKAIRDAVNLDRNKVEIEPEDGDAQAKKPIGPPKVPEQPKVTAAEAIGAFMRASLCESVQIADQFLRIQNAGSERIYRIRDWRNSKSSIPVFGLDIGSDVLREAMILERWLGPSYQVDTADDSLVISDGERTLILAVDS